MRILLVEDDMDLAQFIRKGLKEEQYAVDFAADGQEGLELALRNPYDLLILDIMLPKLDGLTLCRRLRAEGNRAPVVLLTARNTVQDKVSGLDTGADDYLTKPFAFAELLARVRALAAAGRSATTDAFESGRPGVGPGFPQGMAGGERHRAHEQGVCPPRVPLAEQESGVDANGDHRTRVGHQL